MRASAKKSITGRNQGPVAGPEKDAGQDIE